jgi:Rieske 2Fe-2S family protein
MMETPVSTASAPVGGAKLSLSRSCYVDESVFAGEVERFLARHWIAACHVSEIAQPGDYVTFEAYGFPIVIVRQQGGGIAAFHNTCRHRGARLCEAESGRTSLIRCRYHGWSYRLDGSLAAWRHMSGEFAKEDFGLRPCAVAALCGFVYVSMIPGTAPNFAALTGHVAPHWARYELEKCKVVAKQTYPVRGNWKLAIENNLECYHCLPSHPEYTSANAFVKVDERLSDSLVDAFEQYSTTWRQRLAQACVPAGRTEFVTIDGQLCRAGTWPLASGFATGSQDGRAVAPLLGTIQRYDESVTTGCVGFLSYVGAMCDYAIQVTYVPKSVHETDVILRWLVRGDATDESVDMSRLLWLWDTTTRQDKSLIELNAAGVASPAYTPGPYSKLESVAADFVQRYRNLMDTG